LLIKHKDEYAAHTIYDAEKQNGPIATTKAASIRSGAPKKIKTYIKPMLATVTKTPFDDTDWLFEIKWDGYRAIAEIKNKEIRFYSRNGIDFSSRFPSIATSLSKMKYDVILDGEIVLMNEKGLPDFQKLQYYENHLNYPLIYYVFDILELDGKNMEELPLTDRKKILKKIVGKNTIIRYCDHVVDKGITFFEEAREKGLEGIMAKKKDSVYTKGYRSKEWLKIKNVQSTEVVIAGYTAPKGGRTHFGSLVLANKKGKQWLYRGHVGTGFSHDLLADLKKKMKPLETEVSPFKTKVPLNGAITWLRPKLVADIAYTEITRDKIFRHPVFLGLREEKTTRSINEEIVEEMTMIKKDDEMKVGKFTVAVTNRHKIFWPDEGYTKGDVIDYYDKMADHILPHLKGRPLSLKRNPNGIRDEGFFHKDAGEHTPGYVDVFKVKSESSNKMIDYIVCNNKATLIYLANLGCIEINPWNSTDKNPTHPTWMVIDIDPSPKNKFTEVVDTALAVKMVLDKAGVPAYCKTSGASGLHVYVPLKNKYDYTTVKDFAHVVASLVQEQLPAISTLERSLSKRGPKIYIDYLQNTIGQTLACVYSLRPVPGACTSTPLEWKEVTHRLQPSQFTIQNLLERTEKKGDLFLPVIRDAVSINKALKALHA
jgi:bifunctional non-homologous end joining protein LigD